MHTKIIISIPYTTYRLEGRGKGGEGRDLEVPPPSKLSGSAYEGSGGEGEEGREGRVCLVLKSPLATPLLP